MAPPKDEFSFQPPGRTRSRAPKRRVPSERWPFKAPPALAALGGLGFLFAALLLLLAVTGHLGITRVEANQLAVKVNYLTGTEQVVTEAGYQFYMPFLSEVYKLDRQTQTYVMKGERYEGNSTAPELTVRANDGSNFSFDELAILFELIPSSVNRVLKDSGPEHNFKNEWIKAFARSVLRDEFGRYSAVQSGDPTTYGAARDAARDRLNEMLFDHGLRVNEIVTPDPRFDPEYEILIERRKEADQEVFELRAQYEQLVQQRGQSLAAVRKEKDVEMQELQGSLVKELRAAEQEAIRVKRSADAYAATRRAEGRATEVSLLAEAEGLVAKYTKEAEGLESRAKALEQRGEVVVREALVQKLSAIKFTLLPYSRDPEPRRLEHDGLLGLGARAQRPAAPADERQEPAGSLPNSREKK